MQARSIAQVPVVDSNGRVIAVHLLKELLGRIDRPNIAVIMAGGRGTRLQPVTDAIPKPMVTVAGRPILERIINHLVGYGIGEVVLSVGYLADVIENHFKDGSDFGCHVTYVREDPAAPLSTGGPLASVHRVFSNLSHPVLVLNGDLVTQFDVASMLRHHDLSKSAVTIGALTHSHEVPFGVLEVDDHGHVQAVVEKPTRLEKVSAGIYVLEPAILAAIPFGVFVPITQVIGECIAKGHRVSAWTLEQDWLDVGRPQDLARARGLES